MKTTQSIPLIATALLATWLPASAQSTAFTYQGFLTDQGAPANGVYDLQFTLHEAATLGNPVGSPENLGDVGVTNGLFTVTLDFTATPFDGSARWLEIGVRPGASAGAYTNLSPRQSISIVPYAIRAANLSGTVAASQLTGTISSSNIGASTITTAMLAPLNASQVLVSDAAGRLTNSTGVSLTELNYLDGVTLPIQTQLEERVQKAGDTMSGSLRLRTDVRLEDPGVGVNTINLRAPSLATTYTLTLPANEPSAGSLMQSDALGNLSWVSGVPPTGSAGGDLTGSYPNPSIAAGAIVNADINAAAGIADTKLASISTAGKVANSATTATTSNTANAIVTRDASGNFSAGTITASFAGSGAGLTSLSASQLTTGTVPAMALSNAWRLTGNSGTAAGAHFVGTSDNQPLEFQVNGQRGLRLEPNADSPNLIAGFSGNAVSNGLAGAVIGGGGSSLYVNRVGQSYATVVGGAGNTASGQYATAAGFVTTASGSYSVGMGRMATAAGAHAVAMGRDVSATADNSIAMGVDSVAAGGASLAAGFDTFAGGFGAVALGDTTAALGNAATAMGFSTDATGDYSTAMGIFTLASGHASVAMGRSTAATNGYTLAAGHRAKAFHQGAFVWADATDADFASSANNQFLVRANGGVGINTNNPAATLDINGSLRVGNGGTVRAKILAGQTVLTSSVATARTNFTVTFPSAFANAPKVVATVAADPGWDVDDTFVISVRKVSTTNVTFNIVRVDTAAGWSQWLRINWQAWE